LDSTGIHIITNEASPQTDEVYRQK
jgi:hypothetical protein